MITRAVLAGIVVATVLGALVNFVPWPVAAAMGLVAGVLLAFGTWWFQRGGTPEPDLSALADEVRAQWKAELQSRGISLSHLLPVAWSDTARPESRGDIHDLPATFLAAAAPQLVIIGPPGSGKTVMAVHLALRLPTEGRPVPVVLSLSSWDPEQPLYRWAASALTRDYPAIGWAQWRRLLASGRILPVLDGFDELPEVHRTLAVRQINTAIDGGNPVVLTSRTDELTAAGAGLRTALVVELHPVQPEDTISYLHRPGDEERWSPVFTALRTNPDGPLATALSSPFVASLARFTYARRDTDPSALCAFPDIAAVHTHLLDALIPAAYSVAPHPDLAATNSPAYPAAKVTEWLTFLARHLDRLGVQDIAWWRLHRSLDLPRRLVLRLSFPVVWLGVLASLLAVDHGWPELYRHGFVDQIAGPQHYWLAAAIALVAGTAVPIGPRAPGHTEPVIDDRAYGLGAVAGLAVFLPIMTWLTIRVVQLYGTDFLTIEETDGWYLPADPLTLFGFSLLSLMIGVVAVLVGWFAYALRAKHGRLPITSLVTTADALAADRRYSASRALGLQAAVLVFYFGYTFGLEQYPDFPLELLLIPILITARTWHAGTSYHTTKLLLGGRMPLRLQVFLVDAYERGLLREVGGVYQFRHDFFQKHLAKSANTRSA
ncbi:NACHT domain-containing protein [Lentzea sp. NPDC051838]|uniref:NACHT domain-containing protein n=1 Tax=Lentzea sp. NPDC051838 TaxID=3154849 RepID=UPI00341B128D